MCAYPIIGRTTAVMALLAVAGFMGTGCSKPAEPAPPTGDAIVLDGPVATSPVSPQPDDWLAGEIHQVPTAALEIPTQTGDGRTVWVARASLPNRLGFVVILDSSAQVIGASPAQSMPGRIPLDRPLHRDGDLLGVLYADNGDGILDVDHDAVVISGEEPVTRQFQYRLSR